MIRFESVTKRYPDGTVAVNELSLEAPSWVRDAHEIDWEPHDAVSSVAPPLG